MKNRVEGLAAHLIFITHITNFNEVEQFTSSIRNFLYIFRKSENRS